MVSPTRRLGHQDQAGEYGETSYNLAALLQLTQKTLIINARDVLRVRQISKAPDVRQNLPRPSYSSANAKSVGVSTDNLPKPASFLPAMGRSSLIQSPLARMLTRNEGSPPISLKKMISMSALEEYHIGPNRFGTPPPPEGELVVGTWAFPRYESLPEELFPPTGPTMSEANLPNGYLPRIDWRASYRNLSSWFWHQTEKDESGALPEGPTYLMLITGFVCRTNDGLPATLQRNGSDTSAVVFACLLRAEGVTIWSDVAGIYSGDPRHCPNAKPLDYITYEEALELAGIGARVLHPASLLPCIHMRMPLLLKSTFDPNLKGTMIA